MCGRYAATRDPATLAADFDAVDGTDERAPTPDHNVAPTKPVLTVVDRGERTIRVMRWGLVPHWAKNASVGNKMINARAETAASKPAFRTALAKRRCLLPADGWFEWQRDGGKKQPYFMTPRGDSGLALAGIWSVWHDPQASQDAPPLISCAVLTTGAIGALQTIHHRMPLVLPPQTWSGWLDPDTTDVSSLLSPSEEQVASLELRPVSSQVNNVRNNGPSLLERVGPAGGEQASELDAPALFEQGRAP